MNLSEKIAIVESILFSYGEPIERYKLSKAGGVNEAELLEIIDCLEEKYNKEDSGIELLKLEDKLQLATKQKFSSFVKEAFELKRTAVLSVAALETLTIIAYNQPVTKSFIEHIRGVDSSGVVNSLEEKGLIEEAGRLDVPGRPIAYRTTDVFLRSFKLSSIDELPPIMDNQDQLSFDDVEE